MYKVQVTGVHTLNARLLKERVASMEDMQGNLLFGGYPLAEDEKFKNERACGFGTLFVVDAGSDERSPSALTAAHCVCKDESDVLNEQRIVNTRIIFNFRLDNNGNLKTHYAKEEVFRIKKVSAHKFVSIEDKPEERIDWAWLKLDKPFNGKPLELDFSSLDHNNLNKGVYAIGYPTGLPAKLVTSASIQSIKKNYFEADLSMFGGNSGSPVFDRISKKVIGILFQGLSPDYHLVRNYEGLGQHRIKARQATKENIDKLGCEKCQYISAIKVHLPQRIVWLELQGRRERIESSNFSSKLYKWFLEEELRSFKLDRTISIVGAFIPLPWTIGAGIYHAVKATEKINKLKEEILKLEQTVSQYREYEVNFLEACYLNAMDNNNTSSLEKVRTARNYSAYRGLPMRVETQVILLQNDINRIKRLDEIEKTFERKFPTESFLKLIDYELGQGFTFAKRTRELILTYMHNDYENPEQSVAKARAKACYKITKHEALYENFPKRILKKISLYMVQQSPRLTFEQALDELGYNRPQSN